MEGMQKPAPLVSIIVSESKTAFLIFKGLQAI
jgi:hypothetical protein